MTTIAWDGKTLAADKRAVSQNLILTVTKVFEGDGYIGAYSGNIDQGLEMADWYAKGANPETFPASQRDKEDWTPFIIIHHDDLKIKSYERTPFAMTFEDKFYAMGSGRDFAITAMHLGRSAIEAVEIASQLDCCSGNGFDSLGFAE